MSERGRPARKKLIIFSAIPPRRSPPCRTQRTESARAATGNHFPPSPPISLSSPLPPDHLRKGADPVIAPLPLPLLPAGYQIPQATGHLARHNVLLHAGRAPLVMVHRMQGAFPICTATEIRQVLAHRSFLPHPPRPLQASGRAKAAEASVRAVPAFHAARSESSPHQPISYPISETALKHFCFSHHPRHEKG